jgi:hypothetical protein
MADSGQQPVASAVVDTLVNEIFEMLMDMEIKRIDHSSHKLHFDTIMRDLPSFSPEVRAERLHKFMSMLQKKLQAHNTADKADKPHRSDKSAAIGHTHGEDSAGDARQDGTSGATTARSCTLREDTKTALPRSTRAPSLGVRRQQRRLRRSALCSGWWWTRFSWWRQGWVVTLCPHAFTAPAGGRVSVGVGGGSGDGARWVGDSAGGAARNCTAQWRSRRWWSMELHAQAAARTLRVVVAPEAPLRAALLRRGGAGHGGSPGEAARPWRRLSPLEGGCGGAEARAGGRAAAAQLSAQALALHPGAAVQLPRGGGKGD